jgi:hypothetical protein
LPLTVEARNTVMPEGLNYSADFGNTSRCSAQTGDEVRCFVLAGLEDGAPIGNRRQSPFNATWRREIGHRQAALLADEREPAGLLGLWAANRFS